MSKEAAEPMDWGNMDCLKLPTPWRHSPNCMMGISRRDFSELSSWRELYWVLLVGYQSCRKPIPAVGANFIATSGFELRFVFCLLVRTSRTYHRVHCLNRVQ